MRGHIRKRGKGSWSIVIDLPRDATGKRRQRWYTVHSTKRDAEARLREVLHSADKGVYIKPQHLKLGDYLHGWLNGYVKTSCSPRTLDGYETIINRHLGPNLGHITLTQLETLSHSAILWPGIGYRARGWERRTITPDGTPYSPGPARIT